jgi:hypothetical protein
MQLFLVGLACLALPSQSKTGFTVVDVPFAVVLSSI